MRTYLQCSSRIKPAVQEVFLKAPPIPGYRIIVDNQTFLVERVTLLPEPAAKTVLFKKFPVSCIANVSYDGVANIPKEVPVYEPAKV